jgi:hypothetical protein
MGGPQGIIDSSDETINGGMMALLAGVPGKTEIG